MVCNLQSCQGFLECVKELRETNFGKADGGPFVEGGVRLNLVNE